MREVAVDSRDRAAFVARERSAHVARELGAPSATAPAGPEEIATELDAHATPSQGREAGRVFLFVWRAGQMEVRALEPGESLTVGRGASADVVVDDTRVSRLHARVTNEGGAVVVRDLGSRNGTRLGGEPIAGARTAARGDVIVVGPVEIVVAAAPGTSSVRPPAAAASAVERTPPRARTEGPAVVAVEPATVALFEMVRKLASVPTNVLVVGETGTGKEIVAERLHADGSRACGPFVRINCASLPETLLESELFGHEKGAFTGAQQRRIGHLEAAASGTVLLDEIGDMPMAMQPKLLRVLETKRLVRLGGRDEIPIDVRVVAATNRDLAEEAAAGRFREDLFYRLSGFTLRVPPLRERKREILPLARLFAARFAAELGFATPAIAPSAAELLVRHEWPGNVRELRNAVEHATVLSGGTTIEAEQLPENLRGAGRAATRATAPSAPPGDAAPVGERAIRARVAEAERDTIVAALDRTGGNRLRAAEDLGISRRTLQYKLAKYNLK